MSGLSPRNAFAQRLFRDLPRRYDLLHAVLSFGQHARWRRAMVDPVVAAAPRRILDVATGTAGVALELSRRTNARVVGVDLTLPMLRTGLARVRRGGLTGRIEFVAGRAERLPFRDASFDAVTVTYLLRYVDDPDATLREIVRTARPGAVIALLDFHVPTAPPWRAAWWLWTRVGLAVFGWLLGGRPWYRVGRFLGPNISAYVRDWPLERQVAAWRDAGLEDVRTRLLSLGGGAVLWGRVADR